MRRTNAGEARTILGPLAVALLAVNQARAQAPLWKIDVIGEYRTTWVKDLDGDGCDDVATTCPSWMAYGGLAEAGRCLIYSGRSQSLLFEIDGTHFYGNLGKELVTLGDVDGDGIEDLALTDHGSIVVCSGKSGSVINSMPYPINGTPNLGNAGDVDSDGASDILVADFGRHVDVLSARTGSGILHWDGIDAGSFAGAGDLDGDGCPDVLVGEPGASSNGVRNGRVLIYSGRDGSLIEELAGPDGDDGAFGVEVAGGSDLDHDGVADLLVTSGTILHGYSGADRTKLADVSLPLYHAGLAFAGDLDKDGIGEILVGMPGASYFVRTVHVFSGRTWNELYVVGTDVSVGMGRGDANGDGILDVLCGGNHSRLKGYSVSAFSGATVPSVSRVDPDRIGYKTTTDLTVSGAGFSQGVDPRVFVGVQPASNVAVIDDVSITCSIDPGPPGILDVTVQNSLGSATLPRGLIRTPAVTIEGTPAPGGSITIRYLFDRGDEALGIYGLPPLQSIDTPPFAGALGIVPFNIFFYLPAWPFAGFDVPATIPDDPSLSGATVLFQALIGQNLVGRPKEGAWTNAAELTIQ